MPVTEWDQVAAAYDVLQGTTGDPYRRLIVDPALSALLGQVKDQTILDAGCGNGYLTHRLSNQGARLTAFDQSAHLLSKARERFPALDFQQADFTEPLPFAPDSFDLILSHLVFQDLPDLTLPLRECQRMLKPGGRLVVSIVHPSFAYPTTKAVLSLIDRLRRRPAQLIANNYQDEGPIQAMIPGLPLPTTRYHRRLSTYVRSFQTAGWLIRSLVEPSALDGLTAEDDQALSNWPIPAAYVPVHLTRTRGVPFVLIFELLARRG